MEQRYRKQQDDGTCQGIGINQRRIDPEAGDLFDEFGRIALPVRQAEKVALRFLQAPEVLPQAYEQQSQKASVERDPKQVESGYSAKCKQAEVISRNASCEVFECRQGQPQVHRLQGRQTLP